MSQLIASDILWSDPSTRVGQVLNNQRFVGTRFGPDVTEVCVPTGALCHSWSNLVSCSFGTVCTCIGLMHDLQHSKHCGCVFCRLS
jgi:hypothetical protein